MSISRVTSKGQVTIPAEVRKALDIKQGDGLIFEMTPSCSGSCGSSSESGSPSCLVYCRLHRPFPGKEAVREEVNEPRREAAEGESLKRLWLDSNVLLRFLTGDPEDMAVKAAKNPMLRAERGEVLLVLSPLVVAADGVGAQIFLSAIPRGDR